MFWRDQHGPPNRILVAQEVAVESALWRQPVGLGLGDVSRYASQGARDVARKQGQSAENCNRDDGQDDALLGHRLPVFPREPCVELLH
jgi:hypothetical protein